MTRPRLQLQVALAETVLAHAALTPVLEELAAAVRRNDADCIAVAAQAALCSGDALAAALSQAFGRAAQVAALEAEIANN